MLTPLAVLLLVFLSSFANATTYYVSETGNNRNSGRSWSTAWRTLQFASNQAMPGDTVVIRRASTPYYHLSTTRSGRPDSPIIFRGENSADPPVISGAIPPSSWEIFSTPGVWIFKDPIPRSITHIKEDNKTLPKASSPECLDGAWHWSGDNLYYRPTMGKPDLHKVWRNKGGGILISGHSWIIISDIALDAGMGSGISIRNGNNNILRKVTATNHWRGININNGSFNIIEDCHVENNQEGIYLENGSSHNSVRRCRAIHNGNLPAFSRGDRHAIAIGGTAFNKGNTIEYCEIAYNGGPPEAVALATWQAPETVLHSNHVHHNYGSGIAITVLSDNSKVTDNSVEYNGIQAVDEGHNGIFGISARGSKNVEITSNILTGNHVSANSRYGVGIQTGPRGAIDIREAGPRLDMRGIIIRGNTITDTFGGPDLAISSKPELSDIIVEPRSLVADHPNPAQHKSPSSR